MTCRRAMGVGVTLVVLAAVSAVSIAGRAGAGTGSSPDKTIPAPPSTTLVNGSDTLGPTSSTAPGNPANPEPPETGINLRANAGLPEILALVRQMTGPTDDVTSQLGLLANVPADVMSPAGSSIREFGVEYHGIAGYFVASVAFTSDATAADAITFYQATLTAAGFVPVADTSLSAASLTHTLRFETPTSPYPDASVEVVVNDGVDVVIEMTITDATSRDVLQAFTGWAAGMPTIAEGEPLGASLVATIEPRLTLTLSTRFGYDGYTGDELASTIRSSLPVGGYALDADRDEDGSRTISLRHGVDLLKDLVLEIADDPDFQATMSLTGTVTF